VTAKSSTVVSAKKVLFGRFYSKDSTQFQKAALFKCFSLFILDCVTMYIVRVHERGEEGVGRRVILYYYLFLECSKVLRAEHFRNR
jgi:hypothetical protein